MLYFPCYYYLLYTNHYHCIRNLDSNWLLVLYMLHNKFVLFLFLPIHCLFLRLCEDKDLYQADIAKILNVSQQTYSRYENDDISIDKDSLIKLALFYNTSVDYLLELTDERKPYPRKK